MVSLRSLALLGVAAVVYAQEMSTLQPCAVDCYNRALAEFSRFGCASAADVRCMCQKPDWGFSIRDCAAAACPAGYAATVTQAANALCATATVAAPTAASTSAPPASAPPPSSTTPAPVSSSSTSSLSSTTSQPSTAAKLTSSSTSPSSTTSATTSATKSPSSTGTRAPASTSGAAAPVSSNQGMTTATKIGLGVGLTVIAIAVIAGIIFFLVRRRQNNKRVPAGGKHWKISEPMPTNHGRAYAQDNHSYETGLSELEMKSRRYEDMVPRQKPRHMV